MLMQKIRRAGNSLVVTIPKEELDRLNLREGDTVMFELHKVTHQIELSPAIRAAFERSWEEYKEDYDDLAEN
jgi:putative addiction module antidote